MASSQITDAWVFVDDENIGAFELPAMIPVLETGDHSLKVFPGVFKNGIAATRGVYPFYEEYLNDTTFFLVPDSVFTVNPTVNYRDNSTYAWIEDFEDISISINDENQAELDRVLNSDNVPFSESGMGQIILTEADSLYIGTTPSFALPTGQREIFIEIDYSTDVELTVGIIAVDPGGVEEFPFLILVPTQEAGETDVWNKMYIDLTNIVSDRPHVIGYQFYLAAAHQEATEEIILMDNIKLIHQ